MRKLVVITLVCALGLQGCAAVVIGAGASVAKVANDRRTLGTQLDDATLSSRISTALGQDERLKSQAHINVEVYNGVALLVGQAPSEQMRTDAEKIARGVKNLRKLHNQVRISEPVAASTTTYDVWLASKVRTQLLADERVEGLNVKVTVEDSEVFLMGLVNAQEAATAVDITRNINGVARVVKAFEIQ